MAKSELANRLLDVVEESRNQTTKEFMDALNPIIIEVELNEKMKTARKLKIFDLFTQMSNCEVRERKKYGRKIARLL